MAIPTPAGRINPFLPRQLFTSGAMSLARHAAIIKDWGTEQHAGNAMKKDFFCHCAGEDLAACWWVVINLHALANRNQSSA